MVKLTDDYLIDSNKFESIGIKIPKYDQNTVEKETLKKPIWVHFGGGNLFRCFHAQIAQSLLNQRLMDSGVIVAETFDDEVINDIYHPFQNRILNVVMKADGTLDKEILSSVAKSIYFNSDNQTSWQYLTSVFENPSLQFVTFSITEKGYLLKDLNGELTKFALTDINGGPKKVSTNMGMITYLLYKRYLCNKAPIAMVSTDNFSENGAKLKEAVLTIAEGWIRNKFVKEDFIDYLTNRNKVTFPWTMIDRITPNPADSVAEILKEQGFEDNKIVHTSKHTNIAPFGNTEETHYLVIEDDFPNGRPPLEKAGVLMTDRQTVNDVDQMKVTACLNPLHTALAIFGSLLGYHSISEEMNNDDLVNLIKNLGYQEDLPVVKDPKIINPKNFLDELIEKRLPNKNIPDTPQRIASDTSQKIPIRYGVTIQHYLDSAKNSTKDLEFIPLIIAGWCRYLTGIDDNGNQFTPSADPMLEPLQSYMNGIDIGTKKEVRQHLMPILQNKEIFGNDLYAIDLGEKIEEYFIQLIGHKGAVIETIHETNQTKGIYK